MASQTVYPIDWSNPHPTQGSTPWPPRIAQCNAGSKSQDLLHSVSRERAELQIYRLPSCQNHPFYIEIEYIYSKATVQPLINTILSCPPGEVCAREAATDPPCPPWEVCAREAVTDPQCPLGEVCASEAATDPPCPPGEVCAREAVTDQYARDEGTISIRWKYHCGAIKCGAIPIYWTKKTASIWYSWVSVTITCFSYATHIVTPASTNNEWSPNYWYMTCFITTAILYILCINYLNV